jgi:hypothetical protein
MGIESATFRLVVQCLSQLRHDVPQTPKVFVSNYPIFYGYINFETRTLWLKETYLLRINMIGVDTYTKRIVVSVE